MKNLRTMMLIFAAACLPGVGAAAIFCVDDSPSFQQSLDVAAVNGENDEIRIRRGEYIAPSVGFNFEAAENFDLDISGGWFGLGDACTLNGTSIPGQTRLMGNDQRRILRLDPAQTNSLSISRLSFNDARQSSSSALQIDPNDELYVGELLIEQCEFFGNTTTSANGGGILTISQGGTVRVRNNFFFSNSGRSTILFLPAENTDIYLTNNTVFDNEPRDDSQDYGVRISYVSSTDRPRIFVANNIFWQNGGLDLAFPPSGGTIFLMNNNIEDTNVDVNALGMANLSVDPQFGTFTGLRGFDPFSPMIDAGLESPGIVAIPTPFEDNWSLGLTDALTNPRVQGETVDIGAVEATPELVFFDGFE